MAYGANNGNRIHPIVYPNIKRFMDEHDLSMHSLADMCDISQSSLQLCLLGNLIRKTTIDKMIAGTGMTYEQLFER